MVDSHRQNMNYVLQKFFNTYPKWHILKFFIDLDANRKVAYLFFKILFIIWFRTVNRIQLINVDRVKYTSIPFLVVQNHSNYNDAILQLCIYAHLGYYLHVFTSESSFSPKAFECKLAHFIELIPRYGTGEACINRMVGKLLQGKIVSIFPAGTYPSGKYANTGLVQEAYSGAARVAYKYWKKTGSLLRIQPSFMWGGNYAYPPKKGSRTGRFTSKIRIIFGKPFVLNFSKNPTRMEFREKTLFIQMKIAELGHQKKLIPNLARRKKLDLDFKNSGNRRYGTH